jgi:site-specific recombinase XerD
MAVAVGGNPYLLQAVLGHAKITTTQLYITAEAPQIVIDPLTFASRP